MSSFTVTLSWWVLPLAATIIAFGLAWWNSDYGPATGHGSIGKGLVNGILAGLALIVSLIAWLIWALLA